MRRSALDLLGCEHPVSLTQLSAILASGRQLSADFAGEHFIQLFLYAHRVAGLPPGVYRILSECAELGADQARRSALGCSWSQPGSEDRG